MSKRMEEGGIRKRRSLRKIKEEREEEESGGDMRVYLLICVRK